MLELHTSLRQAPPSSKFLWDASGTLSGLHMSSGWKEDDVKDGCTRRNGWSWTLVSAGYQAAEDSEMLSCGWRLRVTRSD